MAKGRLFLLLRMVVAAGLIGLLCMLLGPEKLRRLPGYLRGSDPLYLTAGLFWLAAGILSGSVRWWLILRALGVHMRLGRAVLFYFMGYFFNNLLPSTVGGDAVKAYYVCRASGMGKEPIASVVLDRTFGIFALIAVAAAGSLLAPEGLEKTAVTKAVGILALAAMAALAVVCVKPLCDRVLLPPMRLLRQQERAAAFFELVRRCLRPRWTSAGAILLSLFAWQTTILMFYCACAAVVGPMPIGYFYLFVPLVALASTLPITIAGIGTAEMSVVGLFQRIPEVTATDAMAAALLARAMMISVALVGWAVFAFKGRLGLDRLGTPAEPAGLGPMQAAEGKADPHGRVQGEIG